MARQRDLSANQALEFVFEHSSAKPFLFRDSVVGLSIKGPVIMNLFSDEFRRNPYPLYDQLRTSTPVLRVPPPFDAWLILDYEGVK